MLPTASFAVDASRSNRASKTPVRLEKSKGVGCCSGGEMAGCGGVGAAGSGASSRLSVRIREMHKRRAAAAAAGVRVPAARSSWLLDAVELSREVAEACRDRSDASLVGAAALSPIRTECFVVEERRNREAGRKWRVRFEDDLAPKKMNFVPRKESSRSRSADLEDLGTIIYEIMLGKQPTAAAVYEKCFACAEQILQHESMQPQSKRDRRLSSDRSSVPLALALDRACLPASLCGLLMALLATSDTDSAYTSLGEVAEDLDRMLRDPDRFLNSRSDGSFVGHLDIPSGKLYGRDRHLCVLLEAYDRTLSSACSETVANPGGSASNQHGEIVLLSGYSGTGKSSLANMAKGVLVEKGAYFISGKFDKMRQGQPLSAIVAAFDDFCSMLLLERPEEEVGRIRLAVQDAVGCDGRVLTDLIPSLTGLIGDPDMPTAILEGRNSRNRLRFIFRKFVQAVSGCDEQHPIVLFLDDLQWADEESLQLIHFLATDRATTGSFLLLGAYRDNEVDSDHPLTATLKAIQTAGVGMTEIAVGEVDLDSTKEFVSGALRSFPHRRTQLLAEEMYRKTGGNALFLRQFLRSLVDDGILRYSLPSRRWEWDLEAIRGKSIADNVVQLMMSKMLKLPDEVQHGLKVASCFGYRCPILVLELLSGVGRKNVEDAGPCRVYAKVLESLDVAIAEGLIVRSVQPSPMGAFLRFSHDQIHLAAYSLIPESERAGMHLSIGRQICARYWAPEAADSLTLVAVNQLNHGSRLMSDRGERIGLARLNLSAGKKLAASSAFLPASQYLHKGIRLLDDEAWTDNYDLCLELHSSCAEAYNVLGKQSLVGSLVVPIFKRGHRFEDQLRGYCTLITSLINRRKFEDALQTGFDVLAHLGESFPDDIDDNIISEDLEMTRDELEGYTMESILAHAMMTNERKRAAMQVMDLLILITFVSRQEIYALVAFRMVRLSLTYGLCDVSSTGFSCFGVVMGHFAGDLKSAYRFGKLGIALQERLGATKCVARIYSTLYGCINFFFEPLQACTEKYVQGFEVGMFTGDVESAMTNAMLSLICGLQCGSSLPALAEQTKTLLVTLTEHEQHLNISLGLPWMQSIRNLSAQPQDPTELTGEFMDQKEFLATVGGQVLPAEISVFFLRMWIAYLFRRYDVAVEMARLRQSRCNTAAGQRMRGITLVNETFYTGLLAATMARSGKKATWTPICMDAIEKMKAWVENCSWNYQHKLELLQAELALLDDDVREAAKAYDKAISSAKEHKFIHEQALACERAAIFSLDLGNSITAKEYFSQSHALYLEWGSQCKADDVLQQIREFDSRGRQNHGMH